MLQRTAFSYKSIAAELSCSIRSKENHFRTCRRSQEKLVCKNGFCKLSAIFEQPRQKLWITLEDRIRRDERAQERSSHASLVRITSKGAL